MKSDMPIDDRWQQRVEEMRARIARHRAAGLCDSEKKALPWWTPVYQRLCNNRATRDGRCRMHPKEKPTGPRCEAFLGCDRPAVGRSPHPVLGSYPTCQRCADKLGVTVEES